MEAKKECVLNLRQIMAVFQEEEEVVVVEKVVVEEEVDYNCNSLSTELELKKLQSLVRSLERQNQQLRSRRDATSSTSNFQYKNIKNNNNNNNARPSGVLECSPDEEEPIALLDGVEELDLDGLFPGDSDEETWLYVSRTEGGCVDSPPLSPLQWCRQMLDSPRSEDAKRTPSLHLPQVSRWRPSVSSPSPSSPLLCRVTGASPNSAAASSPPLAGKPCSTPLFSRRPASPLASPSLPSLRGSLSPLLKELLPPAERSPTFLPHSAGRSRRSGLSPERSDDDEGDYITMAYKLHDLTDVQVMARLQEENLRAHRYFSFINPRRSASGLRQRGASSGEETQPLAPDPPPPQSQGRGRSLRASFPPSPARSLQPPPAPRVLQRSGHAPGHAPDLPHPDVHLRTLPLPPGAAEPRRPRPSPITRLQARISWPFCPVEAHVGNQLALGSDHKLGRSMPNLVRAPSMPSVPASANQRAPLSLLPNSLSFDSSVQLQPSIQLQNRVERFSSSSPGQPLKATAYVSPTIKGSGAVPTGIPVLGCRTPTASRSCLPRPATSSTPRSRIAKSARSLSTPPKSLLPLSALRHAGWNDGCY